MNTFVGPFTSGEQALALTGWSRRSLCRSIVDGDVLVQDLSPVVVTLETSDIFLSIDEARAITGLSRCALYYEIIDRHWPIQRIPQPGRPPLIRIALQSLPFDWYALCVSICQGPAFKSHGVPLDMAYLSALIHQEARRRLAILGEAAPMFTCPFELRPPDMLGTFLRAHQVSGRRLAGWRITERYLMAICAGRWIDE